jgi:radical SAM-linked protein
MALISHLDLVRLFDRAVRRAASPFLSLGAITPVPAFLRPTRCLWGPLAAGEIADFELAAGLEPETFRHRLAEQLPLEMPIVSVAEVPLNHPSATKSLDQADYVLALEADEGDHPPQWAAWCEAVLQRGDILWEHTTKSGKVKTVNLRDRLDTLTLANADLTALLPATAQPTADGQRVALYYRGSCRNDGTLLRPEHVLFMVEQVAGRSLVLRHIHRHQLFLQSEA